jgi:hypothetical protein
VPELRPNNSRVSVRSRHLAPYHPDLRPLPLFRRPVDKRNFLAEVESRKIQDQYSVLSERRRDDLARCLMERSNTVERAVSTWSGRFRW